MNTEDDPLRALFDLPPQFDEDGNWIEVDESTVDSTRPWPNSELNDALGQLAQQVTDHIFQIDTRIELLRKALRLLQPLGDGRIDIRFWKLSRMDGRHPVVFKWVGMRRGASLPAKGVKHTNAHRFDYNRHPNQRVYRAERLPISNLPKRAGKKGLHRQNYYEISDTLSKLSQLLKMRAAMLKAVAGFKRAVTIIIKSQVPKIAGIENELKACLPEWRAQAAARRQDDDRRRELRKALVEQEKRRLARTGFQFVEPDDEDDSGC